MQLHQERPDYEYVLRGADGRSARVNERTLERSFVVSPDALVEDWPVSDATAMQPDALAPLLARGALASTTVSEFVAEAPEIRIGRRGCGGRNSGWAGYQSHSRAPLRHS